jgi:hypothetical protein
MKTFLNPDITLEAFVHVMMLNGVLSSRYDTTCRPSPRISAYLLSSSLCLSVFFAGIHTRQHSRQLLSCHDCGGVRLITLTLHLIEPACLSVCHALFCSPLHVYYHLAPSDLWPNTEIFYKELELSRHRSCTTTPSQSFKKKPVISDQDS